MKSRFEEFCDLPVTLQEEAIREGELRLQSQLSVASDADKRALTWAGFLISAASALVATTFAIARNESLEVGLVILGAFLSVLLLSAAWLAVESARPSLFSLPGNSPENWLPSVWDCHGSEEQKRSTARCDQARHIATAISDNKLSAKRRADQMRLSLNLTFFAAFAAVVCMVIYLLLT